VELTEACPARIEALNPRLNAILTVTGELAHQQARAAQAAIARHGPRAPLGAVLVFHDVTEQRRPSLDVRGQGRRPQRRARLPAARRDPGTALR